MAGISRQISARFLCGLRGSHAYYHVWTPVQKEAFCARQERCNPHDCYAIEVCIVMPLSDANKRAPDKYRNLVTENHKESVNGNFSNATATVLADLYASSESDIEDEEEQ